MENQEKLKKQVKDLIAANRTEKALKLLAEKQLNSLDRELILLNGRFNKIKDDQRMGIINNEAASMEINKINIGLLDLSEKIGSNTKNTAPEVLPSKEDKKSNKMLPLIIGGVLLLAIIGYFGIRALNSSSSDHAHTPTPSAPLVQVDFTMDKTTCTAPCEVQFTSNSQDADSFFWEFGDGQTSNLPNPLHKYVDGKTYSVTLTAISKTTNNKVTKSIKINPVPPPVVGEKPLPIANFKMNKSTCIAPCKITFTNLSKNATKYSWKVGNKKESGKKDFKRSFNTPGKYSIKLTASNGSADNTYEQFIQIDEPQRPSPPPPGPLPVANFKMNKTTCTAPCKITFTNLSKNASNYIWKINDKKMESTRDFKRTFKSAGKYSIKLIASSGSKQNTYEQFIQIDAPPPSSPTYASKKMKDGKIWMTENLNIDIPGSWCHENNDNNCKKYGRLYTWEASKKACPSGWHLPSDSEWIAFANAYGGYNDFRSPLAVDYKHHIGDPYVAYKVLIDGGSSGFSVRKGGSRSSEGKFYGLKFGSYWSSTEHSSHFTWAFSFGNNILTRDYYGKRNAFSCRCVKN